ncbi:hypothetical protein P154DRAFT_582375 [Amniculicola lignicola CBS 123094]|uniref:F-box domain-containing protein n=1 Tax=Amniculicola lignicola CBS 123094 TaxID=1392246 RepID=A0A6A5VYT3_9PLEO|nr:hypothetical protein P154DRAFT_582375 [Amniculicola lignicola CBS 123094]
MPQEQGVEAHFDDQVLTSSVANIHLGGPSVPSLLDKLPTEILTVILENVVSIGTPCGGDCTPMYNQKAMGTLALVCRRFNYVVCASPWAFSTLRLETLSMHSPGKFMSHLALASLRTCLVRPRRREDRSNHYELFESDGPDHEIDIDPSLGRLCRRVMIRTPRQVPLEEPKYVLRQAFYDAKRVSGMLPNVLCFHYEMKYDWMRWPNGIKGGLNTDFAWPLLEGAMLAFKKLRHVSVVGPYLAPIVAACTKIPTLRILELKEALTRKIRPGQGNIFHLEPEMYGASSITTLMLSNFRETPFALWQLLRWPRSLEHFSFDRPGEIHNIHRESKSSGWTLNTIRDALLPHAESLKELKLVLKNADVSHPLAAELSSLSDFTSVEKLTLDGRQITNVDTQHAAGVLLHSSLRSLGITISKYGQHFSADVPAFGHFQAEWLRRFATEANVRNSALEEIEINLDTTEIDPLDADDYDGNIHWVAECMRPMGMALVVNDLADVLKLKG